MQSPVVLEKLPEYHSKANQDNDKGFPFDEEETADGAWSELAARHPDIAARLRTRPSGWARKRRSSHNNQPAQDTDDFGSGLGEHFNRFPFDDIPPEFREHIPGHWGHRFVPQERAAPEQYHEAQQSQPQSYQTRPARSTTATQTEENLPSSTAGSTDQNPESSGPLPQYGLRNTVDLGQKTPADPSLVDAESERNQRSMSAPPDNRVPTPNQQSMGNMMGGNPPPPPQDHQEHNSQANVRHIPIFVEGRDEPIINKSHPEPAANYSEPKQQSQPQPQYAPQPQPHYAPPPPEREYYFEREPAAGFDHPPNFSRTFGSPFGKGFRQGPQPFAPQKPYQQNPAPQGRSQSPKPQPRAPAEAPQQHYTQIPVQHEHMQPSRQQQYQQPQQQHHQQPPQQRQQSPQPQQQHHQQPPQQRQQSPQPPPQQVPPSQQAPPPHEPLTNDPITKILSIQKDVLDLMTEVENFVGTKADKRYIYLDEMLTRNLIKLDDIETEGKENIRQARKEAIKCIQKCIAVLEAKADGKIPTTPQPNVDVQMKLEHNKEVVNAETTKPAEAAQDTETKEDPNKDNKHESMQLKEKNIPTETSEVDDNDKPATENKRTPEDMKESTEGTKDTPKKTKKVVKKRDKSKDKKEPEEPVVAEDNVAAGLVHTQESDSKQADGAQPMETEASAVSSQ